MTVRRRRCSDRSGRKKLRSPGRPPVARNEERRRFWVAIATGNSSEDAAIASGVSPAVGARWFREAGGMPPSHLAAASPPQPGRYSSFAEREEISILRAQGHGVREIARRLVRAASTLSRERRRNAATRSGGLNYRATTAIARHAFEQPASGLHLLIELGLQCFGDAHLTLPPAMMRGAGIGGRNTPWARGSPSRVS